MPNTKGTNHGVPIMLVCLLCGGPYYAGVPIMRGSILCGGPYYTGVPVMRGSLLCGCPYYAGVPIKCGTLKKNENVTDIRFINMKPKADIFS